MTEERALNSEWKTQIALSSAHPKGAVPAVVTAAVYTDFRYCYCCPQIKGRAKMSPLSKLEEIGKKMHLFLCCYCAVAHCSGLLFQWPSNEVAAFFAA